MITNMFAVFDSKAAVFGLPFFMANKGLALRSFTDFASDPKTMVYNHPEDFSLFFIGTFDDEKGVVDACKHENLGNASAFKRPERVIDRIVDLGKVNGVVEEAVR